MKKALAVLLCLVMLVAVCACTPTKETSKATSDVVSTESEVSAEESTETTIKYSANVPEGFKWGEEQFIIKSTWADLSNLKYTEFGYGAEDMEATVINDAVATRNDIVEDIIGAEIVEDMVLSTDRFNTGEFVTIINQAIDSGTADFSAITPSLYHAGALALKGHMYDLTEIENMELQSEWWDAFFVEEAEVLGQLYFVTGDIGFYSRNSITAVLFNKEIAANLELENPYELVRNNKWTFDTISKWSKLFSKDLDSDNVIGHLDQFGMGGQNDNMWAFFYAAGETIAKCDENGNPYMTIEGTRIPDIMAKIQEITTDTACYVNANKLWSYSLSPVQLTTKAFVEDRSLLFCDAMLCIEDMRTMDTDFGILPCPLYDENQERYHSMLNPWNSSCIGIAINVLPDEVEDVAIVLNLLGAEAKNYITPAYVETTLKGQRLRDDDSEEMLDIILNNIGCDIGHIYDFAHLGINLLHKVNEGANFTTTYDSYKIWANQDIQKLINTFEQLGD